MTATAFQGVGEAERKRSEVANRIGVHAADLICDMRRAPEGWVLDKRSLCYLPPNVILFPFTGGRVS